MTASASWLESTRWNSTRASFARSSRPLPKRTFLRKMKGLRNILVHEYGEVADRIVFRTAGEALKDFPAFRRDVVEALRKLE